MGSQSGFSNGESDVIQLDTSQLNSPSQGSPVTQLPVHGTSPVLQATKDTVPGFTPLQIPGFVFIIF